MEQGFFIHLSPPPGRIFNGANSYFAPGPMAVNPGDSGTVHRHNQVIVFNHLALFQNVMGRRQQICQVTPPSVWEPVGADDMNRAVKLDIPHPPELFKSIPFIGEIEF
jgi:hypothetical protein